MPVRNVRAEIGGTVIAIERAAGEPVSADDTLLVLEAMKMEMPITTPVAGHLRQLTVQIGDVVEEDQILAMIEY